MVPLVVASVPGRAGLRAGSPPPPIGGRGCIDAEDDTPSPQRLLLLTGVEVAPCAPCEEEAAKLPAVAAASADDVCGGPLKPVVEEAGEVDPCLVPPVAARPAAGGDGPVDPFVGPPALPSSCTKHS